MLVDGEVLACRAVVDTLAAFGHAATAESIAERFIGVSNRDMYAALAVDVGGALPADFDAAMKRRALALFEQELAAIAALDTVLPRLAIAKCVASSSLPDDIVGNCDGEDLLRWFSPAAIFTRRWWPWQAGARIFLYAAAKMGAGTERSIAIEDSTPGVTAAKAAGMATSLRRRQPLPPRP